LKRAIQAKVANPLSMKILEGEIPMGSHIVADAGDDGELKFETRPVKLEA
jgi:ATP-dependent Clp protease ATP-binding subunit ClpA